LFVGAGGQLELRIDPTSNGAVVWPVVAPVVAPVVPPVVAPVVAPVVPPEDVPAERAGELLLPHAVAIINNSKDPAPSSDLIFSDRRISGPSQSRNIQNVRIGNGQRRVTDYN
jgi:hypothetical protein